MQIPKYIKIPSTNIKYLGYAQLLISLLTGLLLICTNLINSYTITSSNYEAVYFFTLLILTKVIFVINYVCRNKNARENNEQIQTQNMREKQIKRIKIGICEMMAAGFVKSVLYFGLTLMSLKMEQIYFLIPVHLSIICVQILYRYLKSQPKHSPTSNQILRHQSKKKSCLSIRYIIASFFISISYTLHIKKFEIDFNIFSALATSIFAVFLLLTYYYLHDQIFALYHVSVDEVISKSYPIQVINFMVFCLLLLLYNSQQTQTSECPKFMFILEYPIQTVIAVIISIIYEYLCLEVIKNSSFRILFLSQLAGIFWFNIYSFKKGINTSLYFSALASFIALILITKIISAKKLLGKFEKWLNWLMSTQSRSTSPRKVIEQQQIN